MNTAKNIAKNFSSLAFAQIISMVSGIILVIFIARFLGDVEYGKMSFAISFTSILVVFADCGLNVMSIRDISRNKHQVGKYFVNTLFIKMFLSLLAFIIIYISINIMDYPRNTVIIVLLFGISTILNTFSQYFRSIFKSFEKMEYEAILNTIYSLSRVILSIIMLYSGFGLISIAYAYIITEIFNIILSFLVAVNKCVVPASKVDAKFCKYLIIEAIPFSMTIFVGVLYLKIDTVMLSIMKGDAVVGWYNAACTLIYALLFIPNVYVHSIFPLMSKSYKTSDDKLKFTVEKSSKYLFIVSLAITLATFVLADDIISVMYGDQFLNSAIALKILSIYLPLRFVNTITGYTLASINKEPFHALGGLIGAITNIILNLILIPKHSFIGAAVATVVTDVILFYTYNFFIGRFFNKIPATKLFMKPVVSFLCAIIVIYLFNFNTITMVILTLLTYILILFLIQTFDREDIRIFYNIMNKTNVKL